MYSFSVAHRSHLFMTVLKFLRIIMWSCWCVFSAPFTIQRLCELLVDPMKHYKTLEKFMRAVEKVIEIHSTFLMSLYLCWLYLSWLIIRS